MAELAIDDVGEYFSIAVRMCAEASVGLHQVVVEHLQQAHSAISGIGQQNWRQVCRVMREWCSRFTCPQGAKVVLARMVPVREAEMKPVRQRNAGDYISYTPRITQQDDATSLEL